MQERHQNRKKYFEEQTITTKKYMIPYIDQVNKITEQTSVLEIGCGEGGNLLPFLEMGCKKIVGIDLSKGKIEKAKEFYNKIEHSDTIKFIDDDIYNMTVEDIGQFDIIFTRDVLEHIHGQQKFIEFIKRFIKPGGKVFFSFPPWYSPFGGHQQMCKSKFLSKIPYFHILPKPMYKLILKLFGEKEAKIKGLLEVKETGISIERFERILKKANFKKDRKTFYFINPNYEVKFGLKPRRAWKLFTIIPFLRNFMITTNYYVISENT